MKLKVDIEKELDSKKKESQSGTQILDTAKLLIEGDNAKEIEILKNIGLGHQIMKAETNRGVNIERSRIENQYEGKVFTSDEIKSICMDYNLRFLPSKGFKGTIDIELGIKMRHFFEKHNLNTHKGGLDTESFYIMAPTKAFNLEDRPKPVPVDPVLFYRPSMSDNKYLLVHKWGNEFTVMRLISGMMTRNIESHFGFVWSFFVCLCNIIFATCGNYSPIIDFVAALVFGTIALIIYMISRSDGDGEFDKFKKRFSEDRWDSIYKD